MYKKKLLNHFAGLSLLAFSMAAHASAPDEARWQAFNLEAIEQHILPNYRALQTQSQKLASDVDSYCQLGTDQALNSAREQFKQAQQAWQKAQHIQFGPVTLLMRNFSLQYWPDKKNLAGKQLNLLLKEALASDTESSFDNEFFADASVAVKGYPAIERLLFDKKMLEQLATNPSYCTLLEAISQHVAQNTTAIVNEWQAELTNYQQYQEDGVYESAAEAATVMLKTLVEPIEAISDAKLAVPLGDSLDRMRWRKSESWRSGQSIENIRTNLASLHHLYSGLKSVDIEQLLIESAQAPLAASIEQQFSQVEASLAEVAEPVQMKYQQAQYDHLVQVQQQLKNLSNNLIDAMAPLDISLGFNRRDGD